MSAFLDQYEFPVHDRAKQIFLLFEGVCPTCGEDNEIVAVGGTEQFHSEHKFNEGRVEVWEPLRLHNDMDGSITFECSGGGHDCYITHSRLGDWA